MMYRSVMFGEMFNRRKFKHAWSMEQIVCAETKHDFNKRGTVGT